MLTILPLKILISPLAYFLLNMSIGIFVSALFLWLTAKAAKDAEGQIELFKEADSKGIYINSATKQDIYNFNIKRYRICSHIVTAIVLGIFILRGLEAFLNISNETFKYVILTIIPITLLISPTLYKGKELFEKMAELEEDIKKQMK